MSKEKLLINRDDFRPDEHGGVAGTFTAGGMRFECHIMTRGADLERAWQNAERAARLVLDRFRAIERRVRSDLAPKLDLWTSERVSLAALTRRVVAAMRASKTVILHGRDTFAEAIFDGPDVALGHGVRVAVGTDGRIASVSLA